MLDGVHQKLTQPVPTLAYANERHNLAVRPVEQAGQVVLRVED